MYNTGHRGPSVQENIFLCFQLIGLALELTVWNYKGTEDEFLGEILLDLGEASIDSSIQCFNLEDHDENSSPLPYR